MIKIISNSPDKGTAEIVSIKTLSNGKKQSITHHAKYIGHKKVQIRGGTVLTLD